MTSIAGVKLNLSHHIGGSFIEPSVKQFPVVNPATEEQIALCSEGTIKDVEAAVAAAKRAFYNGIDGHKAWKDTSGVERKTFLDKLAALMERDQDILALIDTTNMGAPLALNQRFMSIIIDMLRYVSASSDRITGETLEPMPALNGNSIDSQMVINIKQPFGVTVGICPWNYPTFMFVVKVAQSLAAGNTIVMKPSEKTPLSASHLMVLIMEAGIPPGVVNLVHGFGSPVGEAMSLHMDVRKISFTGSGAIGRVILANSARSNLKDVTLELGGKSAAIVFEDADLKKTIPNALFAALGNSGQTCAAHTRLYVQESIVNEFLEGFTNALASWKTGEPTLKDTMGGPLVDSIQYERVKSFLECAKTEAEVIAGGEIFQSHKGFYIQPTILVPNSDNVSIVREEIFGPVVCVMTFKTEEEVIARVNDSEYGLSAGVYTENLSRGIRVAREVEAGGVGINAGIGMSVRSAFGGTKQSGIGRELGSASTSHWTENKTITITF
ncbi:hypothetical protein CBS101457_006944 [Exobasidium rhododendri]|nr:hypothetical protein CBS101457_006944 [Exobasidium rhododendri]